VSTVGRQCGEVRHQLDKSGYEKETWENDSGMKIKKENKRMVDKMHRFRQYTSTARVKINNGR